MTDLTDGQNSPADDHDSDALVALDEAVTLGDLELAYMVLSSMMSSAEADAACADLVRGYW